MIDSLATHARKLRHSTSFRFARFRRDTGGMAAIEFALLFPMMFILYFGMIDVTDLLSKGRKVTLAASTIGDLVAQAPGSLLQIDLQGLVAAVAPILDPIAAASIKTDITVYRKSGSAAVIRWHYTSNGTCSGTLPTNMISMMADNNDLVVARVCTTVYPITGKIIGSGSYTLNDQFILRPREAPVLTCSNCPTT